MKTCMFRAIYKRANARSVWNDMDRGILCLVGSGYLTLGSSIRVFNKTHRKPRTPY